MPDSETLSAAAERDRLAAVLREAGEIALKTFRAPLRSWTKGRDSPVTEADIAVDGFLRERLSRPDAAWLSEESHDDASRLASRRLHVVDPIDGTRAYLAGRTDWSICAALVEDGRPVAGAIYAPAAGDMYLAARGAGASLNGRPIAAADGNLDGVRVAGPQAYLDRLSPLIPQIVRVPKVYSLALRLARVADGQIDVAMASVNAHDWDLAAADLLVHEAGGVMTDVTGHPLVYNLHDPRHGALIAAGRKRHAAVLGLVRSRRRQFA